MAISIRQRLASQLLIIGALYVFTWVDWKALLDHRKLVWVSHPNATADMPRPDTLKARFERGCGPGLTV